MPRGDRTGPVGMGPLTGRAAGYCAGFRAPGYANPLPGYGAGRRWAGFGRGFGRGRGFGPFYGRGYGYYGPAYVPAVENYGYYNQPNPEAEKEFLVNQTGFLKEQLSHLEKRLAELEGKGKEKKEE